MLNCISLCYIDVWLTNDENKKINNKKKFVYVLYSSRIYHKKHDILCQKKKLLYDLTQKKIKLK